MTTKGTMINIIVAKAIGKRTLKLVGQHHKNLMVILFDAIMSSNAHNDRQQFLSVQSYQSTL